MVFKKSFTLLMATLHPLFVRTANISFAVGFSLPKYTRNNQNPGFPMGKEKYEKRLTFTNVFQTRNNILL